MAKMLVVSDFWLVVNGDWASCKSQAKIASCTTEKYNLKVMYNIIMCTCVQLKSLYRDLARSSYLKIL